MSAKIIRFPVRLSAWTTYEQLTDEQRERFGGYVKAKDDVRLAAEWNRKQREKSRAALKLSGGDTQEALALVLAGRV